MNGLAKQTSVRFGVCGLKHSIGNVVGIGRKGRAGYVVRVSSEEWSVVGESIPEIFPFQILPLVCMNSEYECVSFWAWS